MHRDTTTLSLRLPDCPMTRGEFRRALDLAHHGRIETGDGAGEALTQLLGQIADKAPERHPQLDSAALLAYVFQAKSQGVRVSDRGLSVEQRLAINLVESGQLSEADATAVMTGTKTITGDILTPTPRDTRPHKTRKQS